MNDKAIVFIAAALIIAGCGNTGGGGTRFLNADLSGCDGPCACTADNQCNVQHPRCDKNSGACVECLAQNDNCGLGKKCVNSVCVAHCDKDADCPMKDGKALSCCGNGCIDTSGDVANCGGCGKACPVPAGGTAACTGGKCGIGMCNPGRADCDNLADNGCEVELGSDDKSCGACGKACVAGAHQQSRCVMGACQPTCEAGYADCDGNAANGCEADTRSDVKHCGGCNMACPAPQNGAAVCSGGACGVGQCAPGFDDCNRNPNDGCETNLSSVQSCGSCNNVCPNVANGSANCVAGQCGIASCNAGWNDCDGALFDGCETNVKNDAANCGACNNVCNLPNAAPTCSNGACLIAQCLNGFRDCNGAALDGCEANLLSDAKNCGACGLACANGQACSNGSCNKFPPACTQGTDVSGSGYTICAMNNTGAWITGPGLNGLCTYSALNICKKYGFNKVPRWGGTCATVCGFCTANTCQNPQGQFVLGGAYTTFDSGGGNPAGGANIGCTVHWECAP